MALPIASLRPPSATRIESTSAFSNARPALAPKTLRILPRRGRIACRLASRACFAEPPAESPSTMKISRSSTGTFGLSSVSASLPGRFESEKIDVAALRSFLEILDWAMRMSRVSSSRSRICFVSFGFAASQPPNASYANDCTAPWASELFSRPFVCPSNCGSATITETAAVRPSNTSRASSDSPLSRFSRPVSYAWLFRRA